MPCLPGERYQEPDDDFDAFYYRYVVDTSVSGGWQLQVQYKGKGNKWGNTDIQPRADDWMVVDEGNSPSGHKSIRFCKVVEGSYAPGYGPPPGDGTPHNIPPSGPVSTAPPPPPPPPAPGHGPHPGIEALVGERESNRADRERMAWAEANSMDAVVKHFGDDFEAFMPDDKFDIIGSLKDMDRDNTPPPNVNHWECRIGLSKFLIPPINVSMSKVSKVNSVGGGLRVSSTPKFNSGHAQTVLSMTLYFPTHQSIWGIDAEQEGYLAEEDTVIDFDKDGDRVIDQYAASLRGLITQFKYAPFLPIKNAHINGALGIDSVALQSMNVSTIDGYPFALAVQLNLMKFNHEVYLPQVPDMDSAIHWGRFRQYIGRGAIRLTDLANESFLTGKISDEEMAEELDDDADVEERVRSSIRQYNILNSGKGTFNTRREWQNGSAFDLYYPARTPASVAYPDLSNFAGPPASGSDNDEKKNWWQGHVLGALGYDYATTPQASYKNANDYWSGMYAGKYIKDESRLLTSFLDTSKSTFREMSPSKMHEYINKRLKEYKGDNPNVSPETLMEVRRTIESGWFAIMYRSLITDPALEKKFEYQEYMQNVMLVKEWEVPMRKLNLDPRTCFVQSVSVNLGNNLVQMQLQMEEEPAYQHIGALDTTVEVSMLVFGDEAIRKVTRAIEHVNNISRLTKGHGSIGFYGIKNVITALCGMKYGMISEMNTASVPNYPGVYSLNLSFVDFDIFQQKREMLSSSQQRELMDSFSKRNPFLRLKQHPAAVNCFPDMPLSIKDDEGRIKGYLDPDYYFRSFDTISEDIGDFEQFDPKAFYTFMSEEDDPETPIGLMLDSKGVEFLNGEDPTGARRTFWEANADQVLPVEPNAHGFTPMSEYQRPYLDGRPNPEKQFETIIRDMAFRSDNGRMGRAFPTYMLWVVDEGGTYAGAKLFDNFYGLQSVLDIAMLKSEDSMDDTLIIQLSNIYSRLSLDYSGLVDEAASPSSAKIINATLNEARNLRDGFQEFVTELETVNLKPGVRIHLRTGYSSNPNNLTTVFNGTVTEVEQGEVVTITCQSDTAELGAIINASDKNGDTGKIDGSLFGSMYFSEPRDLMTRLLTMGSSTVRETISRMTNGEIFSENRFGIKHFGMILTDSMTPEEQERIDARSGLIDTSSADLMAEPSTEVTDESGEFMGSGFLGGAMRLLTSAFGMVNMFNLGVFSVFVKSMNNLGKKRDFELFKRNIYPGNGTGLTQFMGGDYGEGGLQMGVNAPTGMTEDGEFSTQAPPTPSEIIPGETVDADGEIQPAETIVDDLGNLVDSAATGIGAVGTILHPVAEIFGLVGSPDMQDDDVAGADEVSFRAFTYMKSVWDIFQTCAALLPNYIVAVRPFENRSTVFYGKPHWNWTSSVIPISKGVPKIDISAADDEWAELAKEVAEAIADEKRTDEEWYQKLNDDVSTSTARINTNYGNDALVLPGETDGFEGGTAWLPYRTGGGGMEMHLPTADKQANENHDQLPVEQLEPKYRWPFYMDKSPNPGERAGGIGGNDPDNPYKLGGTIKVGDDASWPGTYGSWGALPPAEEKYYMAMRWPYAHAWKQDAIDRGTPSTPGDWRVQGGKGLRLLVVNVDTGKACVCTPGDWGPGPVMSKSTDGVIFGFSPDAFVSMGSTDGHTYNIGFLDNSATLGPTNMDMYKASGATGPSTNLGEEVDPMDILKESTGDQEYRGAGTIEAATLMPDFMRTPIAMERRTYTDQTVMDGHKEYSETFGHLDPLTPVDYSVLKPGLSASAEIDPDTFYDENNGKFDPLDEVGLAARAKWSDSSIGDPQKDFANANSVWLEMRVYLLTDQHIQQSITREWPHLSWENANEIREEAETDAEGEALRSRIIEAREAKFDDFMKRMWNDPYPRAWAIITADRKVKLGTDVAAGANQVIGAGEAVAGVLGPLSNNFIVDALVGVGKTVVTAAGDVVDDLVAEINRLDRSLLDWWNDGNTKWEDGIENGHERDWNFDRLHGAFKEYVDAGGGDEGWAAALAWMKENGHSGKYREGLGILLDEFHDKIWSKVSEVFRGIISAVGASLTGVVNMIRMSLMMMNGGLQMGSFNQKQANILNGLYNDSIYYSAGPVGSLAYYVDNPFTREFHEPVVEVREPFQKLHMISSFENIIDNRVTEVTGVPTVITATSNGSNAVTVHFDKGAPSDRQVEQTVETGLKWQKPDGLPLVKYVLHPIKTLESIMTNFNNGDYETSAKRVALWFLKESLKDIYAGEIVIIGDPTIRPHDLLYIADPFTSIFGLCEVEQVVHHFNSELGFVTSITPNAIVTINDPVRWGIVEHVRNRLNTSAVRRGINATYGKANRGGYTVEPSMQMERVAETLAPYYMGSLNYTGGSTALVKDYMAADGMGVMNPADNMDKSGSVASSLWGGVGEGLDESFNIKSYNPTTWGGAAKLAAVSVTGPLLPLIEWKVSEWVRDDVMDQQGCYIQYLTKNGRPMDAGLSFNRGVAVGQQKSSTILKDSLRIELPVQDENGQNMISTNILMEMQGWQERQVNRQVDSLDLYINETMAKLMEQSGRPAPSTPANEGFDAYWVKLESSKIQGVDGLTRSAVIDGDTVNIEVLSSSPNAPDITEAVRSKSGLRLSSIDTEELDDELKSHPAKTIEEDPTGRASLAFLYLHARLMQSAGEHNNTFAIRINRKEPTEKWGRHMGWIFADAGSDLSSEERKNKLMGWASSPHIGWDTYKPNGKPYTLNWELVAKGHASVYLYGIDQDLQDEGADYGSIGSRFGEEED